MVDPIPVAGAAANVTAALPVVTDSMTIFSNWMVTNYPGLLIIGMAITRFGAGIILGAIKGGRRRR